LLENKYRQHFRFASFAILAKTLIIGGLLGEIWFFSQELSLPLIKEIEAKHLEIMSRIALTVTIATVIFYILSRLTLTGLKRLVRSRRWDILAMLIISLSAVVAIGGLGSAKYRELAQALTPLQICLMYGLPIAVAVVVMIRACLLECFHVKENALPFFIDDEEKTSKADDLLGLREDAERFASRVLNGGASNSLVFGVDAPWGTGKSSFVNLCAEYWRDKCREKVIVYRFDPLRYEDKTNLFEKFVDGFITTVQTHAFMPELERLAARYTRMLTGKGDFSFWGLKFEAHPTSSSIDETFDELEMALGLLKVKIVVVVDDLDRLNFATVKEILFALKKSFRLSNVSYVLCYDTETIIALDKKTDDAEKVREFLEKFVNVKISLFIDTQSLANFVTTNFDLAVKENLLLDPLTRDKLKLIVNEIAAICVSHDFHHYSRLLGDVRKIKRLVNTMMLCEIQQTDFETADFDKRDLIHLLFLYANFPSIFRAIYNAETNGRYGVFSVRSNAEIPRVYENSNYFKEYKKTVPEGAKFLLTKLFDVDERFPSAAEALCSEEDTQTLACFNGADSSAGRNLERYLKLIVQFSKLENGESYRSFVKLKDLLVAGTPITDVFANAKFDPSKGESSSQQVWRVITNSVDEFPRNTSAELIRHLVKTIGEYSKLEIEQIGVGNRRSIIYSLLKLIDQAGWRDEYGRSRNNTPENIREISDWIFGEAKHVGEGIVDRLFAKERGVIGLYDVLLFRFYCSADRNNSLFQIARALSLHASPTAPESGLTTEIAIFGTREISQRIFAIFDIQYIRENINLLKVIDEMTWKDLCGRSETYVQGRIDEGTVLLTEIERLAEIEKSQLKAFIIHHLSNSRVDSGVGCGFYDPTGDANDKQIAVKMNDYLFELCFSSDGGESPYEHFLDFLLIQLTRNVYADDKDSSAFYPSLDAFTTTLNRERLKNYWQKNKDAIFALKLQEKGKTVVTGNYSASYAEDLPKLYKVLDSLLAAQQALAAS
jgi:hypothetical protein